jgi:hypothetical protein
MLVGKENIKAPITHKDWVQNVCTIGGSYNLHTGDESAGAKHS